MKMGILIKNGTNEHPCWQNDDGTCSLACPNLCNKEGFTYKEALILSMSGDIAEFECAVDGVRIPKGGLNVISKASFR